MRAYESSCLTLPTPRFFSQSERSKPKRQLNFASKLPKHKILNGEPAGNKKMDGRKDIRAWLAERKNALMNKNSKRDYEEKIFSESKRQKTEDQENEEYEIVCTGK